MSDATPPSRLQLPPGPWRTLIDGLCARFPGIPRATWLDRLARGRVLDVSGAALTAETPYRTGMEIRYFREVAHEPRIPFDETIVHADDDLIVADKPHFLPVMPSGPWVRETLLARLIARFDNPQLVPLHRIDRDTAGLVMFSANPTTRAAYQALFRERNISKHYEAIAPALPRLAFPHVRRTRLQRGEPFFCTCETPGDANSETHIDVRDRGGTHWHYLLRPVTGKKHQLRVHMAALGAPILNDPIYPPRDDSASAAGGVQPAAETAGEPVTMEDRSALQLLAASLEFIDPVSGQVRRFQTQRRLAMAP